MTELETLLVEAKKKWGQSVVEAIKKKIDELNINDRGQMKASVNFNPSETADGDNPFSIIDYGEFQDSGVNPVGQKLYETEFQFKGKYFGTAEAIKSWSKLGEKNPYAVAYKIQFVTGLKPRKFYRSVIEANLEKLGEIWSKTYNDYLTKQIESYNSTKK